MAYSEETDLLKEFSLGDLARLTGDTTGATVDYERINYARQNADAEIDGYLTGRYIVPFSDPAPQLVRKISISLTVVFLYEFAYGKSTLPGTIYWRRLAAYRLLKDLQKGISSLPDFKPGTSSPPPVISNKTASDRFFNDDLMNRF